MKFSLASWAAVLEKGMWSKGIANGNVYIATQIGNRRTFVSADVALHGLLIFLF